MKVLFVVNPISGGKDKNNFVKNTQHYCYSYGIEDKFYFTGGKYDTELISEEIQTFKPDRVLSIGGDGTFRMVCSALKGKNIPLGYVPFGSANGMNKDLFTGESPWECMEALLTTHYTQNLDIVEINGMDCIHLSDVGVNAQLIKAYEQNGSHGMMSYAKNFLKALSAQETYRFVINVDGKIYEKKGCMLMIANGTRYGSGVVFNKDGCPFDGFFDIIILRQVNLKMFIRAMLKGFEGEIANGNYYSFHAKAADINISRETTLQIDGEVAGRFDNLKVELSKQTIPVLMLRNTFSESLSSVDMSD